jgi:hypothetical protein
VRRPCTTIDPNRRSDAAFHPPDTAIRTAEIPGAAGSPSAAQKQFDPGSHPIMTVILFDQAFLASQIVFPKNKA